MNNQVKISVIIPVYNGEKNIEKAIKSVLAQNYNNYELILVDGDSKDNTLKTVEKYKKFFKTIISEQDKGFADAVNKGINNSSGEYIFILAADDYLLPKAFYSFSESVHENTDIWCGDIIIKDKNTFYEEKSNSDLRQLYKECSLKHPASFFSLKAYQKWGKYSINYVSASDHELFLRMYINDAIIQIENIPIVLFAIGGISTNNPMQFACKEDYEIAISYGMSIKDANAIYKQKVMNYHSKNTFIKTIKDAANYFHILKYYYKIKGIKTYSKKEIKEMGIPIDVLKSN